MKDEAKKKQRAQARPLSRYAQIRHNRGGRSRSALPVTSNRSIRPRSPFISRADEYRRSGFRSSEWSRNSSTWADSAGLSARGAGGSPNRRDSRSVAESNPWKGREPVNER